jgi:hypothetical protein
MYSEEIQAVCAGKRPQRRCQRGGMLGGASREVGCDARSVGLLYSGSAVLKRAGVAASQSKSQCVARVFVNENATSEDSKIKVNRREFGSGKARARSSSGTVGVVSFVEPFLLVGLAASPMKAP